MTTASDQAPQYRFWRRASNRPVPDNTIPCRSPSSTALIPSFANFPLETIPQELFAEIASHLAFEDKRNLSQASRTCYFRSGTVKPENRRQWIRYLQSQCRSLPSDRLHPNSDPTMEVCEVCLEIVPYQANKGKVKHWWVQNEYNYRRAHPNTEPNACRTANDPFRAANYVGVCSKAGIRWTHEQWKELACWLCLSVRQAMLVTQCREKGQCKKWQVGKKVPVEVWLLKKIKAVVKSYSAAGWRGFRRGNRTGRF